MTARRSRRACAILERAQRIRVAGFRSCRAPAHAFVYLCRMFRRDVTLLGGDGGALEAELAALGKKEAVVVIGFTPYSRELGPVVEAAQRHGVPLIAIADSMAAPIARHAEVTSALFDRQSVVLSRRSPRLWRSSRRWRQRCWRAAARRPRPGSGTPNWSCRRSAPICRSDANYPATAASIASPSRSTTASTVAASMMKGGAMSTWSPLHAVNGATAGIDQQTARHRFALHLRVEF